MANPDTDYPLTRASLLLQLSENDQEAWQQFVETYRPIIYRMARKRGLQDADAQDLAQQVLVSISQSIARWEKRDESVRFRHWLRRVARNAILNVLTRKPKDLAAGGTSVQQVLKGQPESEDQLSREIELERKREVFFHASGLLKQEVSNDAWQVFQLSIVDGQPAQDVAAIVGKTVGATYAIRGRLTRRLRALVEELENVDE
ncbi:MAG: sigma-70 family RNA polymerase sigma factor [Planctomycetota bacterium]